MLRQAAGEVKGEDIDAAIAVVVKNSDATIEPLFGQRPAELATHAGQVEDDDV